MTLRRGAGPARPGNAATLWRRHRRCLSARRPPGGRRRSRSREPPGLPGGRRISYANTPVERVHPLSPGEGPRRRPTRSGARARPLRRLTRGKESGEWRANDGQAYGDPPVGSPESTLSAQAVRPYGYTAGSVRRAPAWRFSSAGGQSLASDVGHAPANDARGGRYKSISARWSAVPPRHSIRNKVASSLVTSPRALLSAWESRRTVS
jgi:hypothetical protein